MGNTLPDPGPPRQNGNSALSRQPLPVELHASLPKFAFQWKAQLLEQALLLQGPEELRQHIRCQQASVLAIGNNGQQFTCLFCELYCFVHKAMACEPSDQRTVCINVGAVEIPPSLHLLEDFERTLWAAVTDASTDNASAHL